MEHDRPRPQPQGLHGLARRGGAVRGGTDDVGYKAVESPHHYSDLRATILRRLGLDHERMTAPVLGRTMRLVGEGEPIAEILV